MSQTTAETGTTGEPRSSSIPPRRSAAPAPSRVLVVDDDPTARRPLELLLHAEGFVVSTASDGVAALEQAARTQPDVVLTDLEMAPMGGIELCRRLRELDPDLPVIVMTGMTDRESVIESLRVGAEDYLTKPVDWVATLWRVNRAIERRRAKLDHDHLRRTLNERLVVSSVREQELADAEARQRAELNALLENLHEGVVIAGRDGQVLMVNAAARAILGLGEEAMRTVDSLYANHALDLNGSPLRDGQRPLMRALRGEVFADVESLHVRPNGIKRNLASAGTCVRDEAGNVVLAIVAFRDVTDQKRLEQQREEYLALISHDLRNPLTAILMSLFVIKDSIKQASLAPDEIVKLAERAERNVGRITHMLDELAEATSMELGGVQLHRSRCDLREIVVSALDGMDDARAKRVAIEADEATAFTLVADPARLERVVANLLSNAIKYSPADHPVVVKLTRPGTDVRLDVVDRGIGIAPESLEMLFDRYGRTAGGRATAHGLGLGLYIARLIVEAHGGRIDVASELGRGSTFTLLLPARAPSSATATRVA